MNSSKITKNFVEKLIASEISQEIEAFYVCNSDEIKQKHKIWTQKFPRIQPVYSVKCNSDEALLKILADLNVVFSCSTKNEIAQIQSNKNRVIFGNPVKQESHIKYAADENIPKLVFDTESELNKIQKVYPGAKLILRLRYFEDNFIIEDSIVRFGCKSKAECRRLLEIAINADMNVIGVCFDTNSPNNKNFEKTLSEAQEIFKIAKEIGFRFNFLNIGNISISGDYNLLLEKYFPREIYTNLEISAMCDRFFVESAFTLVTKIHSKRTVKGQKMYYLGHGAFGSFNLVIFSDFPELLQPKPLRKIGEEAETFLTTFWGPTCDSFDSVVKDVMFPELEIGDWVVFENMGAYSISLCSKFNGIPVPEVYYV